MPENADPAGASVSPAGGDLLAQAERALAQGAREEGAALLARAFALDPRPEPRAQAYRIAERHLREPSHAESVRSFAPLGADPLVSVVVATRNRPRLLRDALAAVAAQTYRRWELVLVNDAGVPVDELARSVVGERLRAFAHREQEGAAYSRNTGFHEARGDVVVFLDDDDRIAENHLQSLVGALAAGPAGAAYSACEIVIEKLDAGERLELSRRRQPMPGSFCRELLLVRNYIPLDCVAFRAELLHEHGGFDEMLPCFEDWELLLRMSAAAGFAHTHEPTAEYHMRPLEVVDSVSKARAGEASAAFARVYARHASLDPLIALAREAYRWLVLSGHYARLG